VLLEDETDLLLFPPLQAAWMPIGEDLPVRLRGWNARRVVVGSVAVQVDRFVHYLLPLSAHQARARAGTLSPTFWLRPYPDWYH
jgi:hypothetical protein